MSAPAWERVVMLRNFRLWGVGNEKISKKSNDVQNIAQIILIPWCMTLKLMHDFKISHLFRISIKWWVLTWACANLWRVVSVRKSDWCGVHVYLYWYVLFVNAITSINVIYFYWYKLLYILFTNNSRAFVFLVINNYFLIPTLNQIQNKSVLFGCGEIFK